MKNIIFTALFGFATLLSADQSITIADSGSDIKLSPIPLMNEVSLAKLGFVYIRFAGAESDLTHVSSLLPGLGLGYRRLAGNGAADISVSGIGRAQRKNGHYVWTAPKASYIHYLTPDLTESPYLGGGLAWGGVHSPGNHFVGIIPSATFGYEFARKSSVLGFAELNISQPALSVISDGRFPGPSAECTVGIGF